MSLFDGGGATRTAPAEVATTGLSATAVTASPRQFLRRASLWIVFTAIAIVVGIIGTVAGGGITPSDPFGSDNPGPTGARGLAEVLRQQGVTVTTAASAAEAAAVGSAPADTTLLVYDANSFLLADAVGKLQGIADHIVLVAPSTTLLDEFAPGVALAGSPDVADGVVALPASCSLPVATRAETTSVGDASVQPVDPDQPSAAGTTFCFPDDSGRYLFAEVAEGPQTVTVLPDPAPFSNDQITRAGNAALALGVLGGADTLIWYLPGLGDLTASGGGGPTVADLTPEWVTPVLLLFVMVFLAAAVWRGRRLGPLVVENLPVVVRSRETMEGRARLYQRSASRGRALDNLRIGAIGRIATMLNLSRTSSVDEVVDATAALLGEPAAPLRGLLRDVEPATDSDLVRMSDDLLRLERAVRRATNPLGPP